MWGIGKNILKDDSEIMKIRKLKGRKLFEVISLLFFGNNMEYKSSGVYFLLFIVFKGFIFYVMDNILIIFDK